MKIKLLVGVLIWFCGFENTVFAQKENYVWYFGVYAGSGFNSGGPIALANGKISTNEGCSSMSDANGSLLFYTDGKKVWNKNHNRMANGFGLAGGWSSTQSALIVPFPGNNFMYYIFTVQSFQGTYHKFNYSLVDMSLNNGKGDVTLKNNLLISPVTEKLTAVKHSNNNDIWVMVHKNQSNDFYACLITSNGISSSPELAVSGLLFQE